MAETETHDTLLGELRRLNLYPPEERQLADCGSKSRGSSAGLRLNRTQLSLQNMPCCSTVSG